VPTSVTAEQVLRALRKRPDLLYAVAKDIRWRLVTPWEGPVTNGSPPRTQECYQRSQGTHRHGYKQAAVMENVDLRLEGMPHWFWRVFRHGDALAEADGYASTKEEAFAECDTRLIEAGFCVPGKVYLKTPGGVDVRLAEGSTEEA